MSQYWDVVWSILDEPLPEYPDWTFLQRHSIQEIWGSTFGGAPIVMLLTRNGNTAVTLSIYWAEPQEARARKICSRDFATLYDLLRHGQDFLDHLPANIIEPML